jgi:phosphoribosylformimino-5-aminoimidazole carboxamide ribotide isomerase
VDVIASGGVGQLDDVVALTRTGARGAIIGKALYTGAVGLPAAIEAVRGTAPTKGRAGC